MLLLGKRRDFSVRFGEPPAFAPGCRFIRIDADEAMAAAGHGEAGISRPIRGRLSRFSAAWPPGFPGCITAGPRGDGGPGHRASELDRAQAIGPRRSTRSACARAPASSRRRGGAGVRRRRVGHGAGRRGAPVGSSTGSRLDRRALPMAIRRGCLPGRTVFAALGDGTFGFHPFELDTQRATPFRWSWWSATTPAGTPVSARASALRRSGRWAVGSGPRLRGGGGGPRGRRRAVERAQDLEPLSSGRSEPPTGLPDVMIEGVRAPLRRGAGAASPRAAPEGRESHALSPLGSGRG